MYRSLLKSIPIGLLSSAQVSAHHYDSLVFHWNKIGLATSLIYGIFYQYPVQMVSKISTEMQIVGQQHHNKRFLINKLQLFIRFIELFAIFMPSMIFSPLAFFPFTRKIWIKVFVRGVEKAGVVWIKLFQYLSHRRDVLGQTMAQSFAPLRQFSPEHSMKQTNDTFKRVYGMRIQNFFQDFNPIPIASGSVSQVYEGTLHKKRVAIKVRHPNIQKNIERDISIIFAVSNFFTFFSRIFQIPVNQHSLKQMLTEQIKFRKQAQNLIKFKQIFKNPDVAFPIPFSQTTDEVLIMSFVPGKPISYFQNNSHSMNKFIARIGASAFFQMLIQHNFIHADCHGGNIFVEIGKKQHGILSYIQYYYRVVKDVLWNKSIKFMLDSEILKKLCDEQNAQDLQLKKQLMQIGQSVKVTLLDVGMVIELQQNKRNYFINFLSQVIQGNPSQCARMIHRISKYAGQLLQDSQYPQYFIDLQQMFTLVKKVSLQKLQGVDVLIGMLTVIRSHRMKLDGQFATLLTNMLTLEAIAKDLDPNINILRCAVPYLPYK